MGVCLTHVGLSCTMRSGSSPSACCRNLSTCSIHSRSVLWSCEISSGRMNGTSAPPGGESYQSIQSKAFEKRAQGSYLSPWPHLFLIAQSSAKSRTNLCTLTQPKGHHGNVRGPGSGVEVGSYTKTTTTTRSAHFSLGPKFGVRPLERKPMTLYLNSLLGAIGSSCCRDILAICAWRVQL